MGLGMGLSLGGCWCFACILGVLVMGFGMGGDGRDLEKKAVARGLHPDRCSPLLSEDFRGREGEEEDKSKSEG